MKRFEYSIVESDNETSFLQILNDFGNEGWEFIQLLDSTLGIGLLFKREIIPNSSSWKGSSFVFTSEDVPK